MENADRVMARSELFKPRMGVLTSRGDPDPGYASTLRHKLGDDADYPQYIRRFAASAISFTKIRLRRKGNSFAR